MIQFYAERFHQRVLSSPAYRLPPDREWKARLHSVSPPGDGFSIPTQLTHFHILQ
jgi:hypothetical protein